MFKGFVLVLQFLTAIPLPFEIQAQDKNWRWALRFFPLAGLIIGGILALTHWLLHPILPPHLLLPLLLTLWIVLYGGLHLDGWMDLADAIGSNTSMERKREIMKDSRVGSFGILALLFLLVWKAALLHSLMGQRQIALILIFVPTLARLQGLFLLYQFEPYSSKGMAAFFKQNTSLREVMVGLLFIIPFLFFKPALILVLLLQLLFTYCFGKWASKHLGGLNGDVIGASIEAAELWNLALFTIWALRRMGG
jgi:adenosylcobinamide-GDP ribazoletransferase